MNLIDRDSAKQAMQDKVFHNYTDEFWGVMQVLEEAPTVDAEPVRHGRWIQTGELDSDGNIPCRCSVCMAGDSHAVGVSVPYCWKCGAKMEGHE